MTKSAYPIATRFLTLRFFKSAEPGHAERRALQGQICSRDMLPGPQLL